MKVVILDQAIDSLEEAMQFLLDQKISTDNVGEIMTLLLTRAESLSENPYVGQFEGNLMNLGLAYKRIVERHFKII